MATHKPVYVAELNGELSVSSGKERWQVLHTKPQCEKKLAEFLMRLNLYYYLPQMESVRNYQYRKVTFTKPMFPSYVFARFDTNTKPDILVSGLVVDILKVPNEAELIIELTQIYQGRSRKAEFEQSIWLDSGWEVEIIQGPLKGLKGIVQNQTKLSEVVLQVEMLRQAVLVRVEPTHVKVIGSYKNN